MLSTEFSTLNVENSVVKCAEVAGGDEYEQIELSTFMVAH